MTFAPMLDVARDPRWGRMVESPGEDPWVASEIATAKTRGFQGRDLAAADSLAATAKHFCAYGAVAAGREYASVDVSERTLLEIYLPPFSAAVAAGAAAVMPAFIDIAGIPMTANAPLLQGWLRDRLGFDGVIVSDYGAVRELLNHGVAGDARRGGCACSRRGRRHRYDEQRLCRGLARGARARSRDHGRHRRQRQAGARAERTARTFRRPVPARRPAALGRWTQPGRIPQIGPRGRTTGHRAAHASQWRLAAVARSDADRCRGPSGRSRRRDARILGVGRRRR